MDRTYRKPLTALPAALLMAVLVGCEAQKSSNPLSPSVAGPIAGVEISPPRMLEPSLNQRFRESQQPIRLLVENASSNGARPLYYSFEVASDSDFQTKMFARSQVPPGSDGRTNVQLDRLELGRTYHWRARAEDGANSGPYVTARFEVLPRAQLGAPPALSPVNNERVSSRRPSLTAGTADRNSAVGPLTLEFHVARDAAFSQMAAAGTVAESGGQTTFIPEGELAANVQHYWRVRAGDGETTSDWSAIQGFITPPAAGPAPPPGPSPAPPSGGSCAGNHGPTIIACISVKYAAWRRPVGSLGERQANMMFLRDRIIEAGKCGGMNLGYNLKRGGPERSIDVLAWKRPDGNMGVDIGMDYDNIGATLQLVWGEVDLFAVFEAYPNVSCAGV